MNRLGLCLLAPVLLVTSSLQAQDDYKQAYKDGLRTFEREKWSEAAAYMEEAIRLNPRAGGPEVRTYTSNFEPYVPYYYLGLSQFQLDNLEAARTALREAETQGVADGRKMRRQIQAAMKEIDAKLGAAPAQPPTAATPPRQQQPTATTPRSPTGSGPGAAGQSAQREVARVVALRNRVAETVLEAEQLGALTPGSDLHSRWNLANQDLQRAQREVQSARDVGAARMVESLAARLIGEFNTLQTALTNEIASAAANAIQTTPPPVETEPTAATRETAPGAAEPSSSRQQLPTTNPPPGMPVVPVEETDGEPPGAVREAARALFSGDAVATLGLLEGSRFDDPRSELQVRLLRSAAMFRQYQVGGRSDMRLLQGAVDEAAQCRRIDPGFEPDRTYFSPAFVALYRSAAGP